MIHNKDITYNNEIPSKKDGELLNALMDYRFNCIQQNISKEQKQLLDDYSSKVHKILAKHR